MSYNFLFILLLIKQGRVCNWDPHEVNNVNITIYRQEKKMCLNENVCESVFYFKPKDEHKKLKCLIKVIEIIIHHRFAYTLHMQ